jgi:uncharacterized membrane protein
MAAAIVQGLHMFFAIFWFGGTLFTNFVVGPAVARSSPASQADVGAQIGMQAERVIPAVAAMTILLGFLRGTFLGSIKSTDTLFGTSYGHWWLIAFLAAIATFLWGKFVTGKAAAAIGTAPEGDRPAAIQRVIRLATVELLGFFTILSMMVLMRFYP